MEWEQIQPLVPGLAMLAVLTIIFWFVVIRPTKKSQQEHQDLITNLTPGDRIITVGGIYGTVRRVHKDTVELEVADGVVMSIDRRAARRFQPQD
ncbi:MAG: preprotein translocase subunit YajC [candidate division WS1 bacterium]|jgi:preprotein translocase subunit YajC|nr:preprotein translocase subunit YajC [candidate division WS1 bacterium]